MIRIYLDWNVISNLKKSEFKELNDFIIEHKEKFLFPYSPAHFKDLMKSYKFDNILFNTDLEKLNFLSEKHLMRWNKDHVEPLSATPQEYFEYEKQQKEINFVNVFDFEEMVSILNESGKELGLGDIGTSMEVLFKLQPSGISITEENKEMLSKIFPNLDNKSSMWDLMKELGPFTQNLLRNGKYYKDFRKNIGEKGFKLGAHAGNWNEEDVIKNIDNFFRIHNINMPFLEYVETALKNKKESYTYYEFYTTAYLMLDMIGYKSDKLPKPTDNMQNIQTDAEHSFYGAHCDYFIALDKKLRIKSKVLYNEFNISTKILTPDEFLNEIKEVIHSRSNKQNFLDEIFSFCKSENIIESFPISKENEVQSKVLKLPIFYFNFFNYATFEFYQSKNCLILTFKRVFKNYSRFIYYTEAEQIINLICNYFGYENKVELEQKKSEFIYGDKPTEFSWQIDEGIIKLEKDEETKRPILIFALQINTL